MSYRPRAVAVISGADRKSYDLSIYFPPVTDDHPDSISPPLIDRLQQTMAGNQSTLAFVNSRRLCEKLTVLINEGQTPPVAYAHHGSLSREMRGEVERKLKEGQLKAIVATHTLEMGIDIGALDKVVVIQSPPSVSSAIRRIGRAGHRVGQAGRGTFCPTHPQDLIESAVLAVAVVEHDIEPVRSVQAPLDVLAQIIVSMVSAGTWEIDDLYVQLRASHPYRQLSRKHFDLVLNMLAGRYADSRLRSLRQRVSIDRLDGTVASRRGAVQVLYTSGGVIPDRGYFQLRHRDTNARIGELDEEFVWEAAVGQVFAFGTQHWRVDQNTHNDVFVVPARQESGLPFWKADPGGRDFHF